MPLFLIPIPAGQIYSFLSESQISFGQVLDYPTLPYHYYSELLRVILIPFRLLNQKNMLTETTLQKELTLLQGEN